MFKIFDRKKNQLDLLENPISPVIVNELGGIGELSFSVPSTYKYLELEGYIQVENDHEYVIKEIVTHGTNREVVCILNIEEVLGMAWSKFISRENTLMKCAELVLSGTGWRAINKSSCTVSRNLYGTVTNSYNLLQMMCTVYNVEFIFDTYNKTVTFVDKVGKDAGVYFINDINLKQLNIDTHTHKYITRVIPVGKDGLTIESVNGGKNYLENKTYSNKNIYGIWQSDKHDNPSALKADAQRFLDEMAIPYETYEVLVDDLYALRGIESFKYELGDIVTIIDGETETRIQQRVIQRTYNLLEPDKDTLHIANKDATFEDYYKRLQTIADMTQSVIGSDGTISGGNISDGTVSGDKLEQDSITSDHISSGSITSEHIKAEQILADHIMANQITTNHLVANSITSDHIQANTIDTKHLKANTITSEHIQSNTIQSNHISSNTITSGHIQAGAITAGSGIIADGAIGSAQISKLDAGKIESGTIDTSKITVQGANGHLRLKGNRMQVFDGIGNQAKERVSIGDVNGDGTIYGLRVRGKDGATILLDENGVTSEGITDGSITNDKINEDANIDGAKLNINSVVNKINEDGTEVIKGTKIEVDGTNLGVKLSEITNKQSEDGEKITQAQAQITANQNAINLKVDEQVYTTDKVNMTSKLEKNTSDIALMKDQIALKVEQTDIENIKNELETSLESKISETKSEIQITTDAISQKVGKLESDTTMLDDKVTSHESRLAVAEQKITDKAITSVVQDSQFVQDMNGQITTNKNNISRVEQTANSITSTVSDLNGKYTQLKQTVDGIDVTGKVSFYDLRTAGATVINGSNITTGTINTNRVNIKGGTTKKIVIANDNYCVYDGSETDVNRKVFMGFRTNTATNVPSIMLGYNGINPTVDGAVTAGGTYTTYSHYPNNNNPEDINQSYGALAFKYGANYTQFSTLNMYQNGDIDLKAGSGIYFRPNLRAKDNHVFGIASTEVGCRAPFNCTSTIYANNNITTDKGLYGTYLSIQGDAGVSGRLSAVNFTTNRIDVYGHSNLDGNMYVSGTGTIVGALNVKNQAINGMGNLALARGTIYLPQGGGNNTTDYLRIGGGFMAGVSSGNFHFLTSGGSTSSLYARNVVSGYSLDNVMQVDSEESRSVFDDINSVNVIDTAEGFKIASNPVTLVDGEDKSSRAIFMTYNEKTKQEEVNLDYTTAISTLWKAVQELKSEVDSLKQENADLKLLLNKGE